MLNFLRKNWYHFAIWSLMIAYVLLAPNIIDRFRFTNGKPIQPQLNPVVTTEAFQSSVDLFEPIEFNGQYLYSLVGWAFDASDPTLSLESYTRYVLLESDTTKYYFALDAYPRPDVEKHFVDVDMDLTNSGIRSTIAKEFISPGVYRIGFVFHRPDAGQDTIVLTRQYLVRTRNQIILRNPEQK